VTALLEYLDFAKSARSWFSHYNSLDWNSILLNYCRTLLSWLIHPCANFQLIPLNSLSGRSGISLVFLDRIIIAHYWFFCYIFMIFSSISFKPQKVWDLIVNPPLYRFSASCHPLFTCGCDNKLVLFSMNNLTNLQVFTVFKPNLVPRCAIIPTIYVPNFKALRLCVLTLWQL